MIKSTTQAESCTIRDVSSSPSMLTVLLAASHMSSVLFGGRSGDYCISALLQSDVEVGACGCIYSKTFGQVETIAWEKWDNPGRRVEGERCHAVTHH